MNIIGTIDKPSKGDVYICGLRIKFSTKDGKTTAKYNVGSRSDMYEYTCDAATETRMICREDSHAKDYCQALAVSDKECTAESLRAIDPSRTVEPLAAFGAPLGEVHRRVVLEIS